MAGANAIEKARRAHHSSGNRKPGSTKVIVKRLHNVIYACVRSSNDEAYNAVKGMSKEKQNDSIRAIQKECFRKTVAALPKEVKELVVEFKDRILADALYGLGNNVVDTVRIIEEEIVENILLR